VRQNFEKSSAVPLRTSVRRVDETSTVVTSIELRYDLRSMAGRLHLLVVALASLVLAGQAAGADLSGVLILHSNQRAAPAQVVLDDALRTAVSEGFRRPVQIYSEYLDDEWTSLENYAPKQADFLHDKYERRAIRVIVAVSVAALRFAAGYRDRIAPGVPIVFASVSPDRMDRRTLRPDVVGTFEDNDPTPTLALALRLHPGTKRIVLVRGSSDLDRFWDVRTRNAMAHLDPRVEVEYMGGVPTADVLEKVGALSAGTLVFTPGYFIDGAGEVSTPRKTIERIAAASAVPVYGAYEPQVGTGIVGAYITSFEDQGKAAGAIVVRLLNGIVPSDIASSAADRVPMVDWRQIRRWRIDEGLLPSETLVRFRDPSPWQRYRIEISIALAVLCLQSALLAALLWQRRRRRRAEEASVALAGRLLTAHEDERRRLARDLHDDVTQRLARLAIEVGRIERSGVPADAARTVRDELVRLSEDVHALSYQLHPSVLDDLGLVEGLRTECDRLARHATVDVSVDVGSVPSKLPSEPSLALFRVAQEALRNVARHANARTVAVKLARASGGIELTVRDDGRGFDTTRDESRPSLGQMSMNERVRLQGGRLRIDSAPDRGTTVTAWIPFSETAS